MKYSSLDHAMILEDDYYKMKFNPVEIPLMDILAVDTMMSLQANRGLARSMVRTCKVEEIILNEDQTEE